MKVFLLIVIGVLLYNSPDARNATGDILRKTADLVDTHNDSPQTSEHLEFKIPNPFHTTN